MFAELGIAKQQLLFSQVTHLLAPLPGVPQRMTKLIKVDDTTTARNVNVNQLKASA